MIARVYTLHHRTEQLQQTRDQFFLLSFLYCCYRLWTFRTEDAESSLQITRERELKHAKTFALELPKLAKRRKRISMSDIEAGRDTMQYQWWLVKG